MILVCLHSIRFSRNSFITLFGLELCVLVCADVRHYESMSQLLGRSGIHRVSGVLEEPQLDFHTFHMPQYIGHDLDAFFDKKLISTFCGKP